MPHCYNVLSPHLDDAVLSCALFLAANPGSRIITVFASGPPAVRPLTPWDKAARCFAEGADVMAVRRREDAAAAELLGASPVHLPYWDAQYRTEQYGYDGPADEELADVIVGDLLAGAAGAPGGCWLMPLGLGHRDHRLTAEVGLRLAGQVAGDWYVYEELPYALVDDQRLAKRKLDLRQRDFVLEGHDELTIGTDRAIKKAAIARHVSQRRPLGRRGVRAAVRAQERIWKLGRADRATDGA